MLDYNKKNSQVHNIHNFISVKEIDKVIILENISI